MTDADDWQQANDAFLGAALTWLRLRLERPASWEQTPMAAAVSPPMPAAEPPASSLTERFLRRNQADPATKSRLARPPASKPVTGSMIEEAARAMDAAADTDPPPALEVLARRFGLSRFERDVLLLCAAMELDTRIAPLCARAQDDPARPYPTFALALSLFDDPAWDVLSPERPLRHWRLIEIDRPGAQPLITSALQADERIVHFLKRLNYLDDRLTPLLLPLEPPDADGELPLSQGEAVRRILRSLELAQPGRRLPVFQLVGPDAPSKRLTARHAAASLGLRLYRLPVELMPSQLADLETFSRLVQRESALAPFALYLDAQEVEKGALGATETQAPSLGRFLAGVNGIFFVATQDVRPALSETSIAVDVAEPSIEINDLLRR